MQSRVFDLRIARVLAARSLVTVSLLAASAGVAHAQSLRDAVDAAWARSPQGQSAAARSEEFLARQNAANAWLADAPALTLAQRSDRLNGNAGRREDEIELSLPLKPWNGRAADQALASAARNQWSGALQQAKWELAGEVREAYWNARLAEIERSVAQRKAEESASIAGDVARRVKAGELARIDLNRAEADRDAAQIARVEAEIKAARAAQGFTQLTGLALGASAPEIASTAPLNLDTHPVYSAQTAALETAKARADQTAKVSRDPLELTLSTIRERGDFVEPYKSSLRVGIRIPFSTQSRNAPRIAEAGAARIETEAALPLLEQRVKAEHVAARNAVSQWTDLIKLAERRTALTGDTAALLEKSFRLGESDLPARLRAESERFDALRELERARIELARATSKLNQSLGLLP
jgi:outer membrane protein, heavy metal efflux system